jgi:hypothetical protein
VNHSNSGIALILIPGIEFLKNSRSAGVIAKLTISLDHHNKYKRIDSDNAALFHSARGGSVFFYL